MTIEISSNTLEDVITELKDKDVMLVDIDQNHAMYHEDDGIYGNRAERISSLSKLIGKLESLRVLMIAEDTKKREV